MLLLPLLLLLSSHLTPSHQVTSSSVWLISASSGQLLTHWSPAAAAANASSGSITLAAASPSQVLVASGGGKVWLLEITEGGELQEVGAVVMDAEVACLDITPVGELCNMLHDML
jgi:hypothetical protein